MSQKRLPLEPLNQRLSPAQEELRLGWCLQNAPGLLGPPTLYQTLLRHPLRREVLRQIRKIHLWHGLTHAWRYQGERLVDLTLRGSICRRGDAALQCFDVSSSHGMEHLTLEGFPATLRLV